MAKKRYEKNPYAYAVVNAMCCFARDYADAKTDLKRNPADEHAKIVLEFCREFADWLRDATGFNRQQIGQMILKMVDEAGFLKVHVFKYSKRKGTRAESMKDQVHGEIKNERSDRLLEAGEDAAKRFFESESGKTRTALFEEVTEEGLLTGYTENYVRVYVKAEGDPEDYFNNFYSVVMGRPYEDGMTAELKDK